MWCARKDSNSRPTGSKPIQAMSNGVSSVQLRYVVSWACREFGVNSVSAEMPRFVPPLLPLALPAALASPAWHP